MLTWISSVKSDPCRIRGTVRHKLLGDEAVLIRTEDWYQVRWVVAQSTSQLSLVPPEIKVKKCFDFYKSKMYNEPENKILIFDILHSL